MVVRVLGWHVAGYWDVELDLGGKDLLLVGGIFLEYYLKAAILHSSFPERQVDPPIWPPQWRQTYGTNA